MTNLISLLPLLLAVLLFGVFAKVAARILRRTQLGWSHALIFGLIVFVLGAIGAFANRATGQLLPLPVAVVAALLLQLSVGGWYLGPRATNTAGEPIAFRGGAMLSFVAYLLVVGFGVLCALVLPLLLRGPVA